MSEEKIQKILNNELIESTNGTDNEKGEIVEKNLRGASLEAKIKELLELRTPLYEAAAHANIMTDVRGAKGVVHQICAQIEA